MIPQDQFRPLVDQAEAFAANGAWPQAIAAYRAALRTNPGNAHVLLRLAFLHSRAGEYRLAREAALQASRVGDLPPQVAEGLIPLLQSFNEIPAMLDCIERMRPLDRIPVPLLIGIAAPLCYANLADRAVEFVEAARRVAPDDPDTLLGRARLLTYLGRFDEAGQDVARLLQRFPQVAQAYWVQAALHRQTPESNHVQAIREQLQRPGHSPEDVAMLCFALHKELDDLGEHGAAWEALMLGCRAKRSTLNYRARDSRAIYEALLRFEPMPPATPRAQPGGATPIFIVGMHRSGTTLLEQLLDGSDQVRGIGELYDFTNAMRHATDHSCRGAVDVEIVRRAARIDLAKAGKRYLDGIAWRLDDERFFTDKLPSNFLNLGFIREALPQAKILHMTRDPVETCFSNLRELFSEANPYSYDIDELADFQRGYRRLMRHWHKRYPGWILDVPYERLVAEPEATMREVCAFCGIDFDPAMLDIDASRRAVVTASAVAVRGGIRRRAQPKWAPYAAVLRPLIERIDRSD
jgi:tetratricopeptide (TPR) repeat protein